MSMATKKKRLMWVGKRKSCRAHPGQVKDQNRSVLENWCTVTVVCVQCSPTLDWSSVTDLSVEACTTVKKGVKKPNTFHFFLSQQA